jgi:hypothetical protein
LHNSIFNGIFVPLIKKAEPTGTYDQMRIADTWTVTISTLLCSKQKFIKPLVRADGFFYLEKTTHKDKQNIQTKQIIRPKSFVNIVTFVHNSKISIKTGEFQFEN